MDIIWVGIHVRVTQKVPYMRLPLGENHYNDDGFHQIGQFVLWSFGGQEY